MKKQLLSAVLAMVLLFSSVPSNVFAEEQYIDEPLVSTTDEGNKLENGGNEKPAEGNENPIEEESGKDENINPENSQEEVLQDEENKIKQRALYADGVVGTVAELQDAVNGATTDSEITLADGFMFGAATLNVPNVNVTVDGGNQKWKTDGMLSINGSGTGSVTIRNMVFPPVDTKRAIEVNATGKVVLDNILVEGRTNTGGNGGALNFESNSNLTVKNSTFKDNTLSESGYSGAAMGTKNFNGTLIVENSSFIGNKNLTAGTGPWGGEGGAIAFNSMGANAKVYIRNSYFEGNEAVKDVSIAKESLADGGALAFFNAVSGTTIEIEGTTFYNNIAGDDGGAILLQTNEAGDYKNVIFRNNTFYKNEAQSIGKLQTESGGAIQLYGNGGIFEGRVSYVNIENNTFVANTAGSGAGALANTGYVTNGTGSNLKNNLFVGNTGDDNDTNNIGALDPMIVNDQGGNIGIDNGTATNETIEMSFGKYGVSYGENETSVEAGYSENRIKVPTLKIMPNGSADEKATAEITDNNDQRGFSRGSEPYDVGSVEIAHIKYNSNKGVFDIEELKKYDGAVYYEPNDEDKITDYYTVGNIGGETKAVDGKNTLKATLEGKEFKEWNTEADGSGETYAVGKDLTYADENIILYAIWGEKTPEPIEEYRVIYDGNTNDLGTAPVDTNNPYAKDSEVTVLSKGNLAKTNYTFKGWNTKSDGSGISYKAGDTFKITANTTLYAQWEKDSEDSGTGWTWSGGSSTTSKEKPKTEETLTHTAYLNGYPDNTIRPQGSITRAEVAAIFARLKVGEANIPSAKANYSDVNSSDWYTKYIAFVTDNKIMEGYEDGSFRPNDKITRAEFTAVVARYNSLTDTTSTFEDVIGHWAAGYIGSVTNKGWIDGYPDGTFKPEKDISREEVATMVNKMLDRKVDKDGLNNLSIKNFKDLDNSRWSYFDMLEASNSHKSVRRTLGDIIENWKELIK